MQVYSIKDEAFKEYGQVLEGYDFSDLLKRLKQTAIPENGIVYQASVELLEASPETVKMQNKGFGGMPIQVGYVGGNNKVLGCLEYHKSSEFNIALDDVVLILGNQSQIKDGKFDTALCKAFLVPAGAAVELFGTALHYAPMNVQEHGYRVVCVLPRGTNLEKPSFEATTTEDAMCFGSNKWLMAHPDSSEAKDGAYIGLLGDNITFDQLEF